ncbi:MAG: hypothetical protein SF052_12220 [Bacteroidia bacterium]|nr:hypothetical protein [Bacteroidia bacterium]
MPALISNYLASSPEPYPRTELIHYWGISQSPLSVSSTTVRWRSDNYDNLNQRITKLLNEYARLKENWDNEGAPAISVDVIRKAQNLTTLLEKHGQPIFHTAPGPWGEVMLDLRNAANGRSLEIIFYPDRSVAVYLPTDETPKQDNFDITQLPVMMKWLNYTK